MTLFWQDLRCAFRTPAKNKGFTVAALLTLTLGIGATIRRSIVALRYE